MNEFVTISDKENKRQNPPKRPTFISQSDNDSDALRIAREYISEYNIIKNQIDSNESLIYRLRK